jgi:hypothetical protein
MPLYSYGNILISVVVLDDTTVCSDTTNNDIDVDY